jgi:hypothetical protein
MKRRDFIVRTVGAVGALSPVFARSQSRPCPQPTLQLDQAPPVANACVDSNGTLGQVCAALTPGASSSFNAGAQSAFSQADLEWQTAFYHDDLHGLVQLMGKPANADTSWKHQYYDTATGQWTVVSNGMWNNPGHIYGNLSIDWTTGDIFQQRSTGGSDHPRQAAWWKYATRSWGFAPPTSNIYSGAMETHANGLAFHPNLYGPGDGALIWNEQANIHFWRKSTNTVQTVGYSYGSYGDKEGIGEYWPAKDIVVIGGSAGGANAVVAPNGGGTPKVTNVGAPPISTAGHSDSGSGGFGSLHVHPLDPNRLIIIERGGSRRVFVSTDGDAWANAGTHPFTRRPYVVCSLRGGLGCLWAIGRDSSGQISTLWKPNV